MGVAKYIKDEKGAIKGVIYQSGIRIKPGLWSRKDLGSSRGFPYWKRDLWEAPGGSTLFNPEGPSNSPGG